MRNPIIADYNYCITVGKTDIGKHRKTNEDHGAHFITQNGLVSVVCDGMGGHVGGAIASEVAITTIHEFLDSQYFEDPREAIGLAIDAANNAIIQRTMVEPELSGMGSTCVLLIVRDAKVYIGHVGDSRIYLIREKKITQLTKDHSFVQMLVDMGEISKEQAEHHPRKNEITNALGLPNMSPATVKVEPITPQAGDCFLLCSDGLSGMVSDCNIEKIVSRQRELRTQERADLLVQTANANGGVDNITVELVEFTITPDVSKPGSKKKTALVFVSLFLLIAIVCGALWVNNNNKYRRETRYTAWGTVVFEKQQKVFAIEVNQSDKSTIVMFNDSRDTIDHLLKDNEQIETNLKINKSETGYSLLFDNTYPNNTDSVFLRLKFGKHQYLYSVRLEKSEEYSTVIDTLTAIPYKKDNQIATLTFIPNQNLILLYVGNKLINNINGVLDEKSVKIENAGIKEELDNDKKQWNIYSVKKDNVEITFVIKKDGDRKEYKYVIPFVKDTQRRVDKPNPPKQVSPDLPNPKLPDSNQPDSDMEFIGQTDNTVGV